MITISVLILALAASSAIFWQGRFKIHHIMKKPAVESGYPPLVYKDNENKLQPVSICRINGVNSYLGVL